MAATILTGACARAERKWIAFGANQPEIDSKDVRTFVGNQNENWGAFADLVETSSSASPDYYNAVVNSGILYVDVRCQKYLDALFWFNRVRDATSREIGYTGAAAAAAMAIVNASKELIGLTPLGFTFLSNTVDNIGKGLLFDLPPSAVKILVEEQQTVYRSQIAKTTYTNKAAALAAIQGYLAICLPANIETQVTEAVARARFKPKEEGPTPAPSPSPSPTPTPTPSPDSVPTLELAPPR